MQAPQPGNSDSSLLLVDDEQLARLNVRPAITTYLRSLWAWRHFIGADARSKAFQGNQEMLLGNLWLILTPLLQSATYGIIFGLLLRTSRGIENFVGYLVLGVIFFGFISRGMNGGSGLIQSSRSMIRSFQFPRVTLVLGLSIRQFLDNVTPALVAIVVALAFQWETPFSWTISLAPLLFVLIHIFASGLAMMLARLTAFVPDIKSLMSFGTRVLFYVSGVFFSVERFATEPILQSLMTANPVYQFLQALRASVLYGEVPSLNTWFTLLAWSVGSFTLGLLFFWQAEAKYVRV